VTAAATRLATSGEATAAEPARTVPPLAAPRRPKLPTVAERTLDSSLRVLAVRRRNAPLVELRLRVPFAGRSGRGVPAHAARATLLGETLLAGTATRSQVQIAADLQEVGGGLSVSVDPDRLLVSGTALAPGLPRLLEILGDVLTGASYPKSEVAGERDRLVERLRMARSQPSVRAREALLARMYDDHPYAVELADADETATVKAGVLRRLHAERVLPAGSVLVLVGPMVPARAVDAVEAALAAWSGTGKASAAPRLPALEPGPTLLVDRPGAVQSTIRVGGAAVGRADEGYAALQLANLVFGGYFSSRLVTNIREDKGYTYSPHSVIDHGAAGSALVVDADVATEVTAPALLEIGYELGRIAALPVDADELEAARQYAIGTLALSTASQAGLTSMLTALAASGLTVEWLRDHPARLAGVTVEQVREQAARFLAPAKLVTVVLGDAAQVAEPMAMLGPVQRAASA